MTRKQRSGFKGQKGCRQSKEKMEKLDRLSYNMIFIVLAGKRQLYMQIMTMGLEREGATMGARFRYDLPLKPACLNQPSVCLVGHTMSTRQVLNNHRQSGGAFLLVQSQHTAVQ